MKNIKIILIVAFSVLINVIGKGYAVNHDLPFWLDSFGTAFSGYILGPFPGACVGLATNLIYSIEQENTLYLYGLTNIMIGIIAGISGRRGHFPSLFGTMTVSAFITVVSVMISVPLNFYYNKGYTGNTFGDGVIEYMIRGGSNKYAAYTLGEFYIDFADKVLTLSVLSLTIFLIRLLRKHLPKRKKKAAAAALLIFCLLLPGFLFGSLGMTALADTKTEEENKTASNTDASKEEQKTDVTSENTKENSQENLRNSSVIDFHSYFQTVYNNTNGLPCGSANDIAETNDGMLWFGTYAGLYRYNGSEFHWMNNFDSVKNVNCLYVDPEGRLWIGTNDNGLSVSINETITNVLDTTSGLPSNSIRSIVMSEDGNYYVGTSSTMQVLELNGGLRLLNEIPEVVYAHSLSAGADGIVAAVTSKGELFLLRDGKAILGPLSCPGDEIYTCCTFTDDGLLNVGTSGNIVYAYSVENDQLVRKSAYITTGLSHINSISRITGDYLFLCTESGIGFLDDTRHYTHVNTNSYNNSIDHMTMDHQGNFWFTSSRLGLLRLSPSAFTDLYGYAGLESKVVNAVTKWNNKYYIGTDSGMDVLTPGGAEVAFDTVRNTLQDVRIRSLYTDSRNSLWVSTYGKGLLEVTEDGQEYWYNAASGFSDWVRCVDELSDGAIVAAGDNGALFINDHKAVYLLPFGGDFLDSMILCILQTKDDRILVGSDGDGIAILENQGVKKKITTEDGLSSNVVLRIVPAKQLGGYFIVTSNGLCYMTEDEKITILNQFPYFNNYDIWETDEGKCFVLGSAGIYVMDEMDIINNYAGSYYELLDSQRGLLAALTANSWNYLDDNGDLYFSTDVGVSVLNLNDYGTVQRSYRMKVSSVTLDGTTEMVERGTPISVGRDVSRIEIYPEIINFTVENPYVKYKLDGFDSVEKTVPADEFTSIIYTNLPTGSYTFRMSILDSNQNLIEESTYQIVKEAEIYDHFWFRIYMLLVPAVAIAWFTWFLARTRMQRTLKLQERELSLAHKQLEMGNQTILAIARAVDAKDENTSLHSQRVSEYSVLLARELGFSKEECENIRRAGLLHDIGKIGIPDRILNKPGRLTDEEYQIMKTHVSRGGEILKDFTLIEHADEGAKYHHEKYDGSGYMTGLKGDEIPLYGRIIAVADAFDAMTQNRVYREKQDISYVVNELKRCSGTQFDPKIADIMLRLIDEGKVPIGDTQILKSYANDIEQANSLSKQNEWKEDKT